MSENKERSVLHAIVTCPFCYKYIGSRFRDHVCQPMKDAFPNPVDRREEKRRITQDSRLRQASKGGKEYFLEEELKGEWFTRDQVIQILGLFGIRPLRNKNYPVHFDFPTGIEKNPCWVPSVPFPPGFQTTSLPTTPTVMMVQFLDTANYSIVPSSTASSAVPTASTSPHSER